MSFTVSLCMPLLRSLIYHTSYVFQCSILRLHLKVQYVDLFWSVLASDFTEKEVNELIEAGAISVGLGPHRLRVETATVALLATLMLWSDSQETCGS